MKITIVLDDLRSCYNVGSIIRTANGFNINQFIFIGTTPYPVIENDIRLKHQIVKQTKQIAKTALGAELKIRGQYFKTPDQYLKNKLNHRLVCIEQTDLSQDIKNFQLNDDAYLVFGNELTGVSQKFLKLADDLINIPMMGSKESFNVSVACGIILHHLSRDF